MNFKLNDDFEVIDLGIQELDVYDIEVEKTHNFFGNNICVHNSTYVNIDEIVKKRWPDITDPQKLTDLIDEFADNDLGKYIQECYEQLARYMNCDENLLDMKRECIAESFIIRAKKNYIMKIYDAEKVRYAEPYYKMMGIEVVRTSHPIMVRDALEHALKIVIDGTQSELRKFVAAFKDEFMNAPLNKIGSPRGNSLEKNAAMRALGVTLIEHGDDFQEAREHAIQLAAQRGAHMVPSFHPDLLRGVATYWWELLCAAPQLDVVYVPIGQGSGACSAIAAKRALGHPARIVGVVSAHATTYADSITAGRVVEAPVTTVLADGMACRVADQAALDILIPHLDHVVQVTDAEVAEAMRVLFTDTHNVAEGAGAAALAAALQERSQLRGKAVGLTLSGGNVDAEVMAGVLQTPAAVQ